MSLYNTIHGMNPLAGVLLKMLDLTRGDFARFRDAWAQPAEAVGNASLGIVLAGFKGFEIAVYTRIGGGNREEYQEAIDALRQHPLYKRDKDDDFDRSYATFYFRAPEQHLHLLSKIAVPRQNMDKVWLDTIADMELMTPEQLKEKYPEAEALAELIQKEKEDKS